MRSCVRRRSAFVYAQSGYSLSRSSPLFLAPRPTLGDTSSSHSQPFSILSLFSSKAPSSSKLSPLAEAQNILRASLNDKQRIPQVERSYRILQQVMLAPQTAPLLTPIIMKNAIYEDLLRTVDRLSMTPGPDLALIQSITSDVTTVLNMPLTEPYHEAVIRSFVRWGMFDQAFKYLESENAGAAVWDIVVEAYRHTGHYRGAAAVIHKMRSKGVKPTGNGYRLFLETLFEHGGRDEIKKWIRETPPDALAEHPMVLAALLVGYTRKDMVSAADRVEDKIYSLPAFRKTGMWTEAAFAIVYDALCCYHARIPGPPNFWEWLETLEGRPVPFKPTPLSLTFALRGMGPGASVNDVRALETRLDVAASDDAWAIIIANAVAKNDFEEALGVFDEAVTILPPSATLLAPIFAARKYNLPRERTLLSMYHDLQSTGSRPPPETFDLEYNTLLRDLLIAISKRQDRLLVAPTLSVLTDMRSNSLAFDPSTTQSVLLALIDSAGSHNAAYNIYTNIRTLGTKFSGELYTDILNAFITLRPIQSTAPKYPPPRLFWAIVKDCGDDGHPIPMLTFKELFRRMRKTAVVFNYLLQLPNPNAKLLQDARQTHKLFKMYAALTPDAELLGVIMDLYSRTGGFDDALAIWDEDLAPGRLFDGRAMSIILDTCSHYADRKDAVRVWEFLLRWERRRPENKLSEKVWQTWIEALCRLNMLSEIERTLTEDLGSPGKRSLAIPLWREYATSELLDIPMMFGWEDGKHGKQRRMRLFMEEHFPDHKAPTGKPKTPPNEDPI